MKIKKQKKANEKICFREIKKGRPVKVNIVGREALLARRICPGVWAHLSVQIKLSGHSTRNFLIR